MYTRILLQSPAVCAGLILLALPSGSLAGPRQIKVAADGTSADVTPTATVSAGAAGSSGASARTTTTGYLSTLNPVYTPSELPFAARRWRVNAGSVDTPKLDYAVRLSSTGSKLRVEIRNSPTDNSPNDSASVRRSELSGSLYLFLSDRRTDLILRGGANIYAAEVEAALSEHSEVADAVAVGLPCADLGQRVHAIIQAPAGLDLAELDAFVRARLSGYKCPES